MNEFEVKQAIIEELENLSIVVENTSEDIDLSSLDIDSITFVSFIVALEDRFQVMFPDSFLSMDVLNSLCGFTNLIVELLSKQLPEAYSYCHC